MSHSKNLKTEIYKTIIQLLYCMDMKWVIWREENWSKAFENRLGPILGCKREENGKWRKLHNEEFLSLYCLPNTVNVIKCSKWQCALHVAKIEDTSTVFKIITGKPSGRHRHIRMDLKDIGVKVRSLIDLV